MEKITISLYDRITIDRFLDAYQRSKKNKGIRKEIMIFEYNLECNLILLMEEIASYQYHCGNFSTFIIYEPKKRMIRKLPFKDRIVHQWYIEEFIKPYYYSRFIYDSYACIENKGSNKAVLRLQHFMRIMYHKHKNYYIVKMDIHKFFDNIDKDVLYGILQKVILDSSLLYFTYQMIYGDHLKKGLPIGNYTSQFFANIYLNELDYYIKFHLHIKYYLRYMDDFVVLVENKQEARKIYDLIEEFVNRRLQLEFNPKSCYFPNRNGVDFCGYKVYEDHILIRKRNIKKIVKKIKNGKCSPASYQSFYGYVKHFSYFNVMKKIDSYYKSN